MRHLSYHSVQPVQTPVNVCCLTGFFPSFCHCSTTEGCGTSPTRLRLPLGEGRGGWKRGPDTLFLPFAHLSLKLPPRPLTEFLLPPPLAHRTCQHRRSSITLDVPLPRHTVRADKGRRWVPTTVPSREEALGEWMGRWTGGLQTPEFLETTSVMFWGEIYTSQRKHRKKTFECFPNEYLWPLRVTLRIFKFMPHFTGAASLPQY